MLQQTSYPDTPQQKGIAKRKNRTLLEITHALLIESHALTSFWPEASATATYLTNYLPSKPLKYKTPFETLGSFVSLPSSHSLPPRIFGCVVYVHLSKQNRTKLEPRVIKCVSLGYEVNQKGYRCFDPLQNQMYTTMNCDFFEQSYYYTQAGPQGDTVSDDLSWLIHPIMIDSDPKEHVGETTDVASEVIVSPLQSTPVPSNEHPTEQEVTPEPLIDISNDDVPSVDIPNRYELPPRSTIGVPPKRYDAEFESQRSRYPPNRGSNEKLSQTAVAFNTSLCSNVLLKSTEEALHDPR